MTGGSIRFRLLIAAAVSVVVALAIAGIGLAYLFERHVERRMETELATHLRQLIAGLSVAGDGELSIGNPPTDPRFDVPLSGLYWQAEDVETGRMVSSRSLWDDRLNLPKDDLDDGTVHVHEIRAQGGGLLVAMERMVRGGPTGDRPLRVAAAVDHGEVERATADFAADLFPSLGILAVVLIIAAWAQVVVGLLPLERLRKGLSEVVSGRRTRLQANVPLEVQPLAGEINRLLDAQERALGKARSAAGDLAHGLKTPLQVLAADIRLLREKGEDAIAEEIDEVAGTIRRHVERELARARAGPRVSAAVESNIAEVAERVIGVVKRTPQGEHLDYSVDVSTLATAAIDDTDLAEILGNLVENASRFAQRMVRVSAVEDRGATSIAVTDDGPGIPKESQPAAIARGNRLDTRGEGAGLGLAIVSDVVEAYSGTLTLEDANPGLRAVVTIPRKRKDESEYGTTLD